MDLIAQHSLLFRVTKYQWCFSINTENNTVVGKFSDNLVIIEFLRYWRSNFCGKRNNFAHKLLRKVNQIIFIAWFLRANGSFGFSYYWADCGITWPLGKLPVKWSQEGLFRRILEKNASECLIVQKMEWYFPYIFFSFKIVYHFHTHR